MPTEKDVFILDFSYECMYNDNWAHILTLSYSFIPDLLYH